MARKKLTSKIPGRLKSWPMILAIAIAILTVGTLVIRTAYINNLKPVSSSTTTSYFTVPAGSSVDQIGVGLKRQGLVRSSSAFKNYVRTNELNAKLQAGTYVFSPSMSVQDIVKKMINGDVAKNLLTILPGKRLDEVKEAFSKAGYSSAEIASAFNPATYLGDPALAYLPKGASLEGFLYPDSFQKISETPASAIVRQSIDEMGSHLTMDITNGFANHGLSIFQGVTLASIVYQETDDPDLMPTVAQVFLSRLAQQMMLQSNVTANYASDLAGLPRDIRIDSLYNTYLHQGLPPGPISNVTKDALWAVAHPDTSDYLYFVAGDKAPGEKVKIYFSRTQAEHDKAIKQYCSTCAQP